MAGLVDITLEAGQQEGTTSVLSSWLKQAGEQVSIHEPVAELETDKVIVEIAAPATGVMAEIVKREGEEVSPGDVLARIDATGGRAAPGRDSHEPPKGAGPSRPEKPTRRKKLSPAVRRMVKEHNVDLDHVNGSGKGGRVTVRDIERHVRTRGPHAEEARQTPPTSTPSSKQPGVPSHAIPHDAMRKRIAEHMTRSLLHTAPHVTSVFEIDMSAVSSHRAAHKDQYAGKGVRLTYTAYFVSASAQVLQHVPEVNSRFHDDHLEIFDDINIGVGTALGDKGLVVPVLHRVQTQSLFGIASRLDEVTAKARAGELAPEDIQGGTFTISNHGVSGSLIAAPIVINQPQTAILGIGKLEKRVVVREVEGRETIQILPMCYVTLTIDHRALDGYQANRFLAKLADTLENWT